MKTVALLVVSSVAFLFASAGAKATVTLAGFSFDDNAFVDQLPEVHGAWTTPTAVIGPNISFSTMNWPYDLSAYLRVGFTDNSIFNAPGADFVLFEESGAGMANGCPAKIMINGITQIYQTLPGSGLTYCAVIDLDDFAVAPNAHVSSITLWGGIDTDYMAIGALHNGCPVPVPGALVLGAIGTGLVTWLRRRRTV